MDQEAHCPFISEGSSVFSGPCSTYPDLSINGFESRSLRHFESLRLKQLSLFVGLVFARNFTLTPVIARALRNARGDPL